MQKINSGWKKITLRKYNEYVKFYNSNKMEDNLSLRLYSFLSDTEYGKVLEMPISILKMKLEEWDFLQEDFSEMKVENSVLDIGGNILVINKDFNTLSFGQWQNMDDIIKRSDVEKTHIDNIHLLIAISSMSPKDYKYEKAVELSELILDEPMYYVIPNIVFFFNKDYQSLPNTLTYLKEIQDQKVMETEVIIAKLRISINSGGGFQRFFKWRMRIFLILMRFWVLRYKKYSSI